MAANAVTLLDRPKRKWVSVDFIRSNDVNFAQPLTTILIRNQIDVFAPPWLVC